MDLPLIVNVPPHWGDLSAAQRKRSWRAALNLVTSMSSLTEGGQQVVQAMVGAQTFSEWTHYPDNDVRDDARASQYFYHAHPGAQRPFDEHGHFHLFVHAEKVGLHRANTRYAPAPAHLIAVSMDAQGVPNGFFVVNRWVTKGPWMTREQCQRGLTLFQIKARRGQKEINTFLHALINLYHEPIMTLLTQRDAVMESLCAQRDRRSVFADREIEVLCYLPIRLMEDIEALEQVTD